MSSPATLNIDLCNFDFNDSFVTFDPFTGDFNFFFDPADLPFFPPGEYSFMIEANVGDEVIEVPATIFIQSPCTPGSVSIVNDPFKAGAPYYYLLDSDSMSLTYDLATIGDASCGIPDIEIIMPANIDAGVIVHDKENSVLRIGPTGEPSVAGDWILKFKYFYLHDPDNVDFIAISDEFTVHISDGTCYDGMFTLEAPPMQKLTYFVGDDELVYDIPPWGSSPWFCSQQVAVQPVIDAGTLNPAAIRVENGKLIVYYDDDLTIAGTEVDGHTYTIGITAELKGVTSPATIEITVKNPCTHETRISLEPATLSQITYMLYDPQITHVHEPVVVNAAAGIAKVCGPITYTLIEPAGLITANVLTYDAGTRTISVES